MESEGQQEYWKEKITDVEPQILYVNFPQTSGWTLGYACVKQTPRSAAKVNRIFQLPPTTDFKVSVQPNFSHFSKVGGPEHICMFTCFFFFNLPKDYCRLERYKILILKIPNDGSL